MTMHSFHPPTHGEEAARMTVEEVAKALRCSLQDIGELTRRGLLKPLGHPAPQNAVKWFARIEILDLCRSREFLDKVTRTLYRYHHDRNQKAKGREKLATV